MKQVVAVDAHKKTCTYAWMTNDSVLEGPRRVASTPEVLVGIAVRIPNVEFVFEACGLQEWMLDVLHERGVVAKAVVPPKKARKGAKSDPKDAVRLGRLYLAGELEEVYVPPPELRVFRDVVRHHEFLTREAVAFKNRLRHELNRWNVRPVAASGGMKPPGVYTVAARDQIAGALPCTGDLYDVVLDLNRRLKRLSRQMELACNEFPETRILATIPGFGPKTSLAFHVETGPVSRFPSASHVVSFYGVEPVHGQSGERRWDEHRISKKGRAYVRGLLTEAAWRHVTTCPDSSMSQWFRLRTETGMANGVAILGVVRRLIETAYSMLRDGRSFTMNGPAPAFPCRPHAKA